MSYPGVDPVDAGAEPLVMETVELPEPDPAPAKTEEKPQNEVNPLLAASNQARDDAPKSADTPQVTENLEKAVKQAVDDIFAVNENAWAPKKVVKFVVDTPSGQKALVKYLGTLDLLGAGLIDELDFFTRRLFPSDLDASGSPVEIETAIQESIWGALEDAEKRQRFLDMTGKLMEIALVKPKVIHDGVAIVETRDEATGETKKSTVFGYTLGVKEQIEHFGKPIPKLPPNAVYSGYIDFADRIAFFQELNKPLAVIEPFREGSTEVLQDLARSEGHGGTA